MIDAKGDTVRYLSDADNPFAGVYLPYHLGVAGANDAVFAKTKMTRKVLTWELAYGDVRIVMKESRETGEIGRIVVREQGEVVLRLDEGAPMQASDLRAQVAALDGFDTRPFIKTFDRAPQIVIGRDDEDHVRGGRRDDRVRTGADDDTYVAGRGDDRLRLGDGDDAADYSEVNRRIDADLRAGVVGKGRRQVDDVGGVEDLIGTRKHDVIRGDGESNSLSGGQGNDVIQGRGGRDRLHGDEGDDRLFGGGARDSLFGGAGDDRLKGGGGALDALWGGEGDDHLVAGRGTDILFGGDGADVFVVNGGSGEGFASIRDYDAAEGDRLKLPGSEFDYLVVVNGVSTEIRRDGDVVAVVDFGPATILEDALFG